MVLNRALLAGLLILIAGLNCLPTAPASAQIVVPLALTEVRLAEYRLSGGNWIAVRPGTPVPASAVKLRFRAKVNRPQGTEVRLKVALHEACFGRRNKQFMGRFQWIESVEPGNPPLVGVDGNIYVDTDTECQRCRSQCNKDCPERDHLGEGPHLATLTIAEEREPAGPNTKSLRSPSYMVGFETICPPLKVREPKKK